MNHVASTKASIQQTASSLSPDKTQSDVIRTISHLAGIALLVLLVINRCSLYAHLCVVVVRMPQDGSKDNIPLWQTVKWLVKFAIIGQTIVVGGKTTLKSRTAVLFTCMSCKKRLHVHFGTVVSVDILRDNVNQLGNRYYYEKKWLLVVTSERHHRSACNSSTNWNSWTVLIAAFLQALRS